MLKIVLFILQIAAVAGGVTAGLALKSRTTGAEMTAEDTSPGEQIARADVLPAGNGPAARKSHSDQSTAAEQKKTEFVKFSRQFIVPVISVDSADRLVILDVNVEVPAGISEAVYAREPKLRDALLRCLLTLATDGAFDDQLTSTENLDRVRLEMLTAARDVIGEDALDILILNITRQSI